MIKRSDPLIRRVRNLEPYPKIGTTYRAPWVLLAGMTAFHESLLALLAATGLVGLHSVTLSRETYGVSCRSSTSRVHENRDGGDDNSDLPVEKTEMGYLLCSGHQQGLHSSSVSFWRSFEPDEEPYKQQQIGEPRFR